MWGFNVGIEDKGLSVSVDQQCTLDIWNTRLESVRHVVSECVSGRLSTSIPKGLRAATCSTFTPLI